MNQLNVRVNKKHERQYSLYYGTVIWKIYNYLHGFDKVDEEIESREFHRPLSEDIKLQLTLKLSSTLGEMCVIKGSLKRLRENCDPKIVNIKVRITVSGSSNRLLFTETYDETLKVGGTIHFGNFDMLHYAIHDYQRNTKAKKMKITCDFFRVPDMLSRINIDFKTLLNDLKMISENGEFSDLDLTVKRDIVHVHAAIAKARSPYIRKYLNLCPDTQTIDLTGRIAIEELKILVQYWYSGDIEKVPRMGCEAIYHMIYCMEQSELKSYIDPEDIVLTTKVSIEREEVKWEIKDIPFTESLMHFENCRGIPYICEDGSWKLTFYPKGPNFDDDTFTLLIENTSTACTENSVFLEVFLLDESNRDYGLKGTISWLHPRDIFTFADFMTHEDFFRIQQDVLRNSVLRVGCRIYTKTTKSNNEHANKDPELAELPTENPYESLSNDLKNLLESEDRSDIYLMAGDVRFNVHKVILAARSDYFSSIFRDQRTHGHDEIKVDDIKPNDLAKLLKYVYYADRFELNVELAIRLYSVNSKYNITGLNTLCSFYLRDHLTADNAIDIIELGNTLHDSSLENSALQCIQTNSDVILNNDRWLRLQNENFSLSLEIMSKVTLR